jgi:CHAD domain-containing protein
MSQTTVSEIALDVFRDQLQAIQNHLDGAIHGWDPERLHDLRVANRRTRAALIEFKGVIPNDISSNYRQDFRWIQTITGEVRDLDVGLEHFFLHKQQIPDNWSSYLDPLHNLLEKKRELAQAEMVGLLRSDRITNILNGWSSFLESGVLDDSPLSLEPAKDFGCRRILKRYLQVRKKGGKLTNTTPSGEFHRFRISIKKLRYLMEFFLPVIDNRVFTEMCIRLKSVQDIFGDLQDAEVLTIHFRNLAEDLHQGGADSDTLLAVGHLLGSLENRKWRDKMTSLQHVHWIMQDATNLAFESCFQLPVDQD